VPVKVDFHGKEIWYKLSDFRNGERFSLESDGGEQINLDIPLKLDLSFKDKKFEVHFLAKKGVKENDIFQAYNHEFNKRIGWIIPTVSLGSTDHDFANDPHFLRYAYVGVRESLRHLDDSIYSKSLNYDSNEIGFSDIFHESTVLLIISKETLINGVQFDIDRASASLIKYGYVRLGKINPEEIEFMAESPNEKKLQIEQISSQLKSHQLISELLNVSFAYEKKAAFKFFFIYQIIELLIDDIYKNEQEKIVDKLILAKGDSGLTKEVLEEMQTFISEKKRISLLVDNYTNMGGELSELKDLCNNLLTSLGREERDGFQNYFYTIRNFIFHQYRDFPRESEALLECIIKGFVDIIPLMLSRYKYP
jgi:hypothetical protein